ncbi:hypothetical protein ACFLZA_00810 [Candidatus Neomarinimicrobiota bacterium]
MTNTINQTPQIERADKDPFILSLSISTETAKTKEECKPITDFRLHQNIPVNETSLTPILTKHLQSTNLWYKNSTDISTSNKDNYSGMTGITIDYDDTVPMSEFKSLFSKYHFILYPSTHHGQKDENGKIMEKYHVIFPLDPNDYDQYINADWHKRAYQ